MAKTPLQSESAQATLPSAHDLAGSAQEDFWDIQNRAEELAELLDVMAESGECKGSMRPALRAVGSLVTAIELQARDNQQKYEDLWKRLPAGENVARFERPN